MANFSVKLVDHTQDSAKLRPLIQKPLQDFFNEVFTGTSDSAAVDWGTGVPSDQIVLHFVEDVDHSYIDEKMPGNNIRGDAGGHTRLQNSITGSEFYKVAVFDGKRSQVKATAMARLAFHEAMHNQFPGWSNADMHGPLGGAGLAASPPQHSLTDTNKALMRKGMAIKNAQLL
jgi:hypothetical protein